MKNHQQLDYFHIFFSFFILYFVALKKKKLKHRDFPAIPPYTRDFPRLSLNNNVLMFGAAQDNNNNNNKQTNNTKTSKYFPFIKQN